jgi:iron-sulfur cluster assembly protein
MFGLTTREIEVTIQAAEYLKNALAGHRALRLAIKGGKGCGGNEYDLKAVNEDANVDEDVLKVDDTLSIYIPKTDVLKLFGATIDFIEDNLGNKRLNITNPNEKGRCGCGQSVTF